MPSFSPRLDNFGNVRLERRASLNGSILLLLLLLSNEALWLRCKPWPAWNKVLVSHKRAWWRDVCTDPLPQHVVECIRLHWSLLHMNVLQVLQRICMVPIEKERWPNCEIAIGIKDGGREDKGKAKGRGKTTVITEPSCSSILPPKRTSA